MSVFHAPAHDRDLINRLLICNIRMIVHSDSDLLLKCVYLVFVIEFNVAVKSLFVKSCNIFCRQGQGF